MRATIMVGLILIAIGATALYQLRNGFFMYLVGHATYQVPSDEAALSDAFAALGEEPTPIAAIPLDSVAETQSRCAASVIGKRLPAGAEAAFQRIGLVLLGAGANSLSPVIPPDVRRLPELRRDLTMPYRAYAAPELTEADAQRFRDIVDALTEPEHPIHRGTNLADNFGHIDLKYQVEVMVNGGEPFHRCVTGG